MSLSVAQTVAVTQAEGPGNRYAIWLQGCPLHCPGCCNPEMIPFEGGQVMTVTALVEAILTTQSCQRIEGITIMGGEPFSQTAALAELVEAVQSLGLSVMIFSGYSLRELQDRNCPQTLRVLTHTDILVDGRYEATQPDSTRRWIGSTNQKIHFLSERYAAEDACWQQPDTLELRWQDGELSLNGFPAKSLSAIWSGQRWNKSQEKPDAE